jgi:hypothetical protein
MDARVNNLNARLDDLKILTGAPPSAKNGVAKPIHQARKEAPVK